MSILNSILKTFVGDKTKKDLSKITPLIAEINTFQKSFESLSHDDLREKTNEFKSLITEGNQRFTENINRLQEAVKKPMTSTKKKHFIKK